MTPTPTETSAETPAPTPARQVARGMTLPELCLRRPVATLTVLLLATVFGLVSVTRLPLEYLPEFSGRSLNVSVSYPSSSPREVERVIVKPLEEELASLEGLEVLTASAQSTGATVRVELVASADVDRAALDVRERIDRARTAMPADVGRIEVRRWRSTDRPVFRFRVATPTGASRVSVERFVDEVLVARLTRRPGVGNVEVGGLVRSRVLVELDQQRLAQSGLTASDVARMLRLRNRNVSAGQLQAGSKVLSVRVLGELGDAAAVAALPIGAGRLLGDVATVKEELPPLERVTRLDGKHALTFRVSKESGSNSVEVCEGVRLELDAIRALPAAEGYRIEIFSDDAERIRARLGNLRTSAIYGGLLLCVVLFLFLRQLRSTLIVALTIPLSVVLTFGFLYLARLAGASISLNVVSLMGLILGIGLVVDFGIVVLENIFRLRQEGLSSADAASQGAAEVSRAITASMITSLIVFVPLVLGDGMGQRWMRPLAIVVCAAVFSSLWVALTAVPLMAARFLPEPTHEPGAAPPPARLSNAYGWVLNKTIWLRWLVIFTVLPLCGWQIVHFFKTVEYSWGGGEERREVEVKVQVPRAFTEQDRRALFARLEQIVLEHRDQLDLARLTTRFQIRAEVQAGGRRHGGFRGGSNDELELMLQDGPGDRPTVGEVRKRLKQLLPIAPGVVYQLGASRRMGGGGRSVSVHIRGRSSQELLAPAQSLAAVLKKVPGVEDVELGAELRASGLEVRPRALQAARLGVAPRDVGQAIAASLGERTVTRLRGTARELDVIMRLEEDDRRSVRDLARTSVPRSATASGEAVMNLTVESVAGIKSVPSPRSIERVDRQAVSSLTVSVLEGHEVRTVAKRVEAALELMPLPRGVSYSLGRNVRRWRRGESQDVESVVLAFALVLILLCGLFESYTDALVIMVTVPFALVGVAWAFWATDTKMSTSGSVGLMILIGIVVNHGIVLVDRVRLLLAEGIERREAVVQAGRDRLRPIVMTAATTVLGLLPIVGQHLFPRVFRGDSGAQVYGPIGLSVAAGLVVSTALTLLVLPALLSVSLDLKALWLRATTPKAEGESEPADAPDAPGSSGTPDASDASDTPESSETPETGATS